MSNSSVGTVYAQIIENVLEFSRVDLEENGVDEGILEELKKGWQKKLSQQQLAVFPWDPKPDPPAPSAPAPSAPQPGPADPRASNGAGYSQNQASGGNAALSFPQPPVKNEPAVKVEPGLETPVPVPQPSTTNVQARVMQNLQAQYGARANATIGKLQDSMAPQGQQRPGGPDPSQPGYGAHPQQHLQQQQQQQQQFPQQQRQQAPGQNPNQAQRAPGFAPNGQQRPAASQMDGAGDDDYAAVDGVLIRQTANGETTELGRVEIDRLLHAQIAARAKSMEGGGLMLPLKRASKRGPVDPVSYHRTPGDDAGSGRFDGGDDDVKSEDDDEAINSDLDDPDDNVDDDDEDDDGGYIMLCMYDKVQRVKNKWKCVLKDGVLSVNGKDYVFHKATGEYEW